jgi:hypothetical protein
LIDGLVACDDPPSEARLTELRQALERKVTWMKRGGRLANFAFFGGIAVMALGFGIMLLAGETRPPIRWLSMTGFGITAFGAALVVAASVALFVFRGFGYVWARHDLQDAALLELSAQIQRLSERLEAVEK